MTDVEKNINYIIDKIVEELKLDKLLDKTKLENFKKVLFVNIKQNRYTKIYHFEKKDIDSYLTNAFTFLHNIKLNNLDIIKLLLDYSQIIDIINRPDFLDKYSLLCVIEDENNSVRRDIMINSPKLYTRSLEEIYMRYSILKQAGRIPNSQLLLERSYNDFIEPYVANTFYIKKNKFIPATSKEYEKVVKKYPINYKFIEYLRELNINKNVMYYNTTGTLTADEKRKIAIENYSKVENIPQLSALTGISTSRLQDYLCNDSKKLVSKEEYEKIKRWLENAKKRGLIRGGVNSQENNGFKKDRLGHFIGNNFENDESTPKL